MNYQDKINEYTNALNNNKKKKKTAQEVNEETALRNKLATTQNAKTQETAITTQDTNAKAQSAIAQLQAQKYVPTELKLAGLNNSGVSEQANTDIRNAYLNAISNQNIATNQAKQNLLSDYQNAIQTTEQELTNANQLAQEEETSQQQDYLSYYVEKLASADNYTDYMRYLDYAKQYLNEDTYKTLTNDLEMQDYQNELKDAYEIEQDEKQKEQYHIVSGSKGVNLKLASYENFGITPSRRGKYVDGKQAFTQGDLIKEQKEWMNKLQGMTFENGQVVDFATTNNKENGRRKLYVYYNGRFYPTSSSTNGSGLKNLFPEDYGL